MDKRNVEIKKVEEFDGGLFRGLKYTFIPSIILWISFFGWLKILF